MTLANSRLISDQVGLSRERIQFRVLVGLTFVGLYVVSRYKYLVFHSIIEIFSVIISGCVFILSTFTVNKEKNAFSLLGIGYLVVAILDLLHTLSYQGMNLFDPGYFYANQLWVCARFIEAVTICLFLVNSRRDSVNYRAFSFLYLAYTVAVLSSVFLFKSFPVCFIEGKGQTPFKIAMEYLVCGILGFSLYLLKTRYRFAIEHINRYLSVSIAATIFSELTFTLYTDNFGILNVVGHLFKLVSFYYIYRSILIVNVHNPLAIIFEELTEKEGRILQLVNELERERNAALKSAITDGLTGMYNRRYFDGIFAEKFKSAVREKTELSVIMIDIDYFKNYNDRYGHLAGDDCLRSVAKALVASLTRATDIVARYGGEEFIAILENTGTVGALKVAERMRNAVLNLGIEHGASRVSDRLTISLGLATVADPHGVRPEDLVSRSDAALYRAKEKGRNTVEVG